jgi:hypothetical protein
MPEPLDDHELLATVEPSARRNQVRCVAIWSALRAYGHDQDASRASGSGGRDRFGYDSTPAEYLAKVRAFRTLHPGPASDKASWATYLANTKPLEGSCGAGASATTGRLGGPV